MKLIKIFLLCGGLAAIQMPATAQDFKFNTEQMQALGITTAAPLLLDTRSSQELPARVVVPPAHDHAVTSRYAGIISQLLVGNGDQVHAGEPLLSLSSAEHLRQQVKYLESLSAFQLAQADLHRDVALFEAGVIPERRLLETRVRQRTAKSILSEQAQLLHIAGFSDAELDALKQQSRMQPQLLLRAPVDGTVRGLSVVPGKGVSEGEVLLHVAATDRLWLETNINAEASQTLHIGMPMMVVGMPLSGRLRAIDESVDPETNTLKVWAELDDSAIRVRPGQLLSLRFSVAQTGHRLAVPSTAVVHQSGRSYVFVHSDDVVSVVPVQLAGRQDDLVIVSGDLAPRSQVVVRGVSVLKAAWNGMGGGE